MKKFSHSFAVSFAVLATVILSFASSASAAEKIGMAYMQKILANHPRYEKTVERIEAVVRAKQNEAKTGMEKATDKQKAQQIYETKAREAAQEENKLMDPIYKEINAAVRTVAKTKAITVVLDATVVPYGGIDITDDVIAELKKKK